VCGRKLVVQVLPLEWKARCVSCGPVTRAVPTQLADQGRMGRRSTRPPKPPSERDWERSVLLEPRAGTRYPELISDGGGLPFPPAALDGPPEPLDPDDPAVGALHGLLIAQAAPKRTARAPWKRSASAEPSVRPSLDGWRALARTDGEVLFARGRPPALLTVAVRQIGRRRTWTCVGSSASRPLRATRDGIRASSWRPDPTHQVQPHESVVRLLVTEQSFAGGQRADGRLLAPDLYVGSNEFVLTLFITPLPGFRISSPNPETPVRIALPHPIGPRQLIDGALARFRPSPNPSAGG
jgi:hypothetical protein